MMTTKEIYKKAARENRMFWQYIEDGFSYNDAKNQVKFSIWNSNISENDVERLMKFFEV